MKLRDRIINLYIALTGGIPQGEGHHNPVKTIMPGMPVSLAVRWEILPGSWYLSGKPSSYSLERARS